MGGHSSIRFALLSLLLVGCSGAPTTIAVTLGEPRPDAAVEQDAAPEASADSPDADAQDAAVDAQDAAQDAGDASDAWVECYGSPLDASALQPSASCFAYTVGCPPCAPYAFSCGAGYLPEGLPKDGLRMMAVDGQDRLCSPTPLCARDTQDDANCFATPHAPPHAYSCSADAKTPGVCVEIDVSGRRVECCD